MKRLSSLMPRRWKEKERWSSRRRSEPCGGEEEKEQTDRRMTRRKSEPCGRVKDCRRTECVEEWTRKSSSWVLQGPGGHTDGKWSRRRRSEPCTTQLLPVSNRTSKDLRRGTSCSEPRTVAEDTHVSRGPCQPAAPLDHSKLSCPARPENRKHSNS